MARVGLSLSLSLSFIVQMFVLCSLVRIVSISLIFFLCSSVTMVFFFHVSHLCLISYLFLAYFFPMCIYSPQFVKFLVLCCLCYHVYFPCDLLHFELSSLFNIKLLQLDPFLAFAWPAVTVSKYLRFKTLAFFILN